jgi:hypothetical protein
VRLAVVHLAAVHALVAIRIRHGNFHHMVTAQLCQLLLNDDNFLRLDVQYFFQLRHSILSQGLQHGRTSIVSIVHVRRRHSDESRTQRTVHGLSFTVKITNVSSVV